MTTIRRLIKVPQSTSSPSFLSRLASNASSGLSSVANSFANLFSSQVRGGKIKRSRRRKNGKGMIFA